MYEESAYGKFWKMIIKDIEPYDSKEFWSYMFKNTNPDSRKFFEILSSR